MKKLMREMKKNGMKGRSEGDEEANVWDEGKE